MQVAIASFSQMPPQFTDDRRIIEALAERGVEATIVPWDDPGADWEQFELVVIRSTWDYARRRDEFIAWCESLGPRLHNAPALVRWNSDKRYLGELAEARIPVIETRFVAPGDPAPELDGEVVVKPNVSAGARDSGRFGPAAHELARELIASIQSSGRTAMVQPYLRTVDSLGETAILLIDGEPAHVLRKRAVLAPDEVAPVREDGLGAAEAMYDPGLVTVDRAADDELELAHRVFAETRARFGYLPLYARVDIVRLDDGRPVLIELEAVEPNFYLEQVPATTPLIAAAIAARLPAR